MFATEVDDIHRIGGGSVDNDSQDYWIAFGRVGYRTSSSAGELFSGPIDFSSMPTGMRQMFEEYEEIVNGQMFSLLDEIQDRIDRLLLRVLFEDGSEAVLADLQIYPSTKRVSFKLAATTCTRTAGA